MTNEYIQIGSGEDKQLEEYVNTHLSTIYHKVSKRENLTYKEVHFLYIFTFLTGDDSLKIDSWSGYPSNLNKRYIVKMRNWFSVYGDKLDWDRHIEEGFILIAGSEGLTNFEERLSELFVAPCCP